MSLDQALTSISVALDKASKENAASGRKKLNMVVDEATVVLVLAETTTKEGGLTVSLAPAGFPGTIGGNYKASLVSRGENTITVKLKSPYMAPSGSPYTKWTPEEIRRYLQLGEAPNVPGKIDPDDIPVLRNFMKMQIKAQLKDPTLPPEEKAELQALEKDIKNL